MSQEHWERIRKLRAQAHREEERKRTRLEEIDRQRIRKIDAQARLVEEEDYQKWKAQIEVIKPGVSIVTTIFREIMENDPHIIKSPDKPQINSEFGTFNPKFQSGAIVTLIWGKLGPTPEEAEVIERFKKNRGRHKRRYPDFIQLISSEELNCRVNVDRVRMVEDYVGDILSLSDFLQNPDSLLPQIARALDHPTRHHDSWHKKPPYQPPSYTGGGPEGA